MNRTRLRKAALFVVALALVAASWEFYKAVGPEEGGKVFGATILPRTSDRAMPHISAMWQALFDYERGTEGRQIWRVVADSSWYSFRLAFVGFVVGSVVGVALAVVNARFTFARRGMVPYLVASQTVPLIALAPIMVSWSRRVQPFGWEIPQWMTVSLLGAFLAFFPVSVGTLRGLTSAPATAVELMNSYAATWNQTLWRLRFPAAIPQMIPALRLAASAAVVGVVVSEISTGIKGGVGRLVIEYGRQATSFPAKVYTAVFGAAAIGLLMAAIVALFDLAAMSKRQAATS